MVCKKKTREELHSMAALFYMCAVGDELVIHLM